MTPTIGGPSVSSCPSWCTGTDHDADWPPSVALHTTATVCNDEVHLGSFTNEDGFELQTVLTLNRPPDHRQDAIRLPSDPDRLDVIAAGLLSHAQQLRAAGIGSTQDRHDTAA